MQKDNRPLSPELTAWLEKRPRFDTNIRIRGNPDSLAYWESAMHAGAVQMADVWAAPHEYFTASSYRFAQLADFDISTNGSLKLVLTLCSNSSKFELHNLWYAWADRMNLSMPEMAERIGKWSLDNLTVVVNPKSGGVRIDPDGWFNLIKELASNYPGEEVEKAYLLSQHLVGPQVGYKCQEDTRYGKLLQLDNASWSWWDALPTGRKIALQEWALTNNIQAAPRIQFDWLQSTPDDSALLKRYLETMDEWYHPRSQSSSMDAHDMRVRKIHQLMAALEVSPDAQVWTPFVFTWFNTSVCESLWSTSEFVRTHGNANTFAMMLNKVGLLNTPNEQGATIAKRLLSARERLKVPERLHEDASWLELGSDNEWVQLWWAQFLQAKTTSTDRILLLLQGVDAGLPLSLEDRSRLWMRSALAGSKAPKVTFKTLRKYFSLPDKTADEAVLDVWLNHWIPGHGKLLSAATGLGLHENREELKTFLISALSTPKHGVTTLPEDFKVEFTL